MKTLSSDDKNTYQIEELGALLRQQLQTTKIARVWRGLQPHDESLLQLASEMTPELAATMKERLAGFDHATELARTPVIGVCGTVNSGKSTLVASFLSAPNRPRVLVGDYDNEATQRFVFWLPESLRHDDLALRCFDEIYANQFGSQAERLADDAATAGQQYNAKDAGSRKLGVPLIAYDAALDEHHLSFLDCPDIQRPMDEESLESTSHIRLDALVKAARLCSAFVVVASQEQLPAKTTRVILTQLREHAPGLPVFLVLNKASSKAKADIANAEKVLSEWGVLDTVHAIYHAPYQREVHDRALWPVYTNLKGDEISRMPSGLDFSELGRAYVRSGISELQGTLTQMIDALYNHEKQTCGDVLQVQKHVRQFLAERFLDDSSNVRTLFSQGISKAILESMERTAPLAIRLAFWGNKPLAALMKSIEGGAVATAEWIKENNPFADKSKTPESPWKNPEYIHTVTPESFADHLKPLRCIRTSVEECDLIKVWKAALCSLAEIDMSEEECDSDKLDKIMSKLWDEVPWYKRAVFAFVLPASLILTVSAVLFISQIDMGASAVKMASIPELLTALGISALFNKKAVSELTRHLEERAGLQQVANLYAALLDGLCIPRDQEAELGHRQRGRKLRLPAPSVAHLPGITGVLEHLVFELDHKALEGIRQTVDQTDP